MTYLYNCTTQRRQLQISLTQLHNPTEPTSDFTHTAVVKVFSHLTNKYTTAVILLVNFIALIMFS